MKMIYADPNNQIGLNTMYMTEEDTFVDEYGEEFGYDEFIGKWIKKRKARRAKKPRIIARRRKANQRRIRRGKSPKYPQLIRAKKSSSSSRPKYIRPVKVAKEKPLSGGRPKYIRPVKTGKEKPLSSNRPRNVRPVKVVKNPKAPKGSLQNPINNKDLKSHLVMNNAVQNELKTMQEELKTEGLKKKVEQEDIKKENLQQQAGLMGAGKGLIYAAIGVGFVIVVVSLTKGKSGIATMKAA